MGNPEPPGGEQLRAALEDLDSDAIFWFRSAREVEAVRTAAAGLDLSGFEFGTVAVEIGLLDKYTEIKKFVTARLGEGHTEMDKLSLALRDARDQIDSTDRDAAADIGTAAVQAIGVIRGNRPGR